MLHKTKFGPKFSAGEFSIAAYGRAVAPSLVVWAGPMQMQVTLLARSPWSTQWFLCRRYGRFRIHLYLGRLFIAGGLL